MRIGVDVSQAVYGTGVSDYTIDLIHALEHKLPHQELSLVGFSLRKRSELVRLFPRIKTFPVPPSGLHLLWNMLHVAHAELFSGAVDVFHTSDWTQPPTASPSVTTIHDLSPFLFPEDYSGSSLRNIRQAHYRKMYWVRRECRKIICVSQNTGQDLARLFPETSSRIVVIPEALPVRFDREADKNLAATFCHEKGIGDDYVVTIGTRQPRKNLHRLIAAYLKYKNELKLPQKLVIVGGKGWGREDYPQDPSIVITGFLNDDQLLAVLSSARVFAYPSLYEGFGLPVLVAFRHKIPVVTSFNSSLPEVAGSAAVLIDPTSEEEIAQGLRLAIADRARLVQAGIERLKLFSWDKAAIDTLKVYQSI